MKLTKQRKGAAIVLGLGVLALGLDRLVLRKESSGPAAANASPAAVESHPPAAVAGPALAANQPPQGPTLSELLEQHRSHAGTVGDAFAVPADWIVVAKQEKPIQEVAVTPEPASDPLIAHLKLSAVSQGRAERRGSVIVNGHTLIQGAKQDLEIGGEIYSVILKSTPAHDTAVIEFVSSGREVVVKR
ncbi:MAG: hypothetical protein KGS45_08385 [Planctomycetes bacterium]|nr:hypothetical protein [Planctomycetota bacterium]